jgi:hypothetical protein
MATARSVSRASDVDTSALGSLFHVCSLIQNPRWKALALSAALGAPTPVVEDLDLAAARRLHVRSVRGDALLVLVERAAARGQFELARTAASEIASQLKWQRGQLALARGYFEHGRITDALRLVRHARDRRIVAERKLLLEEIRLVLRPASRRSNLPSRHELAEARPARYATGPSTRCRYDLLLAVQDVWFGVRDRKPMCFELAVARFDTRLDRSGRRTFLGMLARSRLDVLDVLLAMRTSPSGKRIEPLLAEYVAIEMERIAIPPALHRGLANLAPTTADARSLERALHDEGIALSAAAPSKRRVLISTAQTCLRSASTDRSWDPEVIATRIRTLAHLGGALAINAIETALDHPDHGARALEALCMLDPSEALRRPLTARLMRLVELRRGVAPGFAHAYARTLDRLRGREQWLTDLLQIWRTRHGGLPEPDVLSMLSERPELPADPATLLDSLTDAVTEIERDWHERIVDRIAEQPALLDALVLARPARIAPQMPVWSFRRWRELFAKLRARTDFVEHNTMVTCARRLGLQNHIQLRLGLSRIGVAPMMPFGAYRLRLLDKRRDLLTYLRFADIVANSCFRSDNEYYPTLTENALIEVWKDPLSFCFHIERAGEPRGFLFGSFALVGDQIGVVLNSLHVRPNSDDVRIGAIRAFEAALCRPLGIERIGIANMHGGRGALPPDYVRRVERIVRLRALGRSGHLVRKTYDDITQTANMRVTVGHLYWRA